MDGEVAIVLEGTVPPLPEPGVTSRVLGLLRGAAIATFLFATLIPFNGLQMLSLAV